MLYNYNYNYHPAAMNNSCDIIIATMHSIVFYNDASDVPSLY